MPTIAIIDASTRIPFAALISGEPGGLRMRTQSVPVASADMIPALKDLYRSLDAHPLATELIIAGCGPGSFTGIRVALSIARTWAQAGRIRVAAMSSLDLLAGWAEPSLSMPIWTKGGVRAKPNAMENQRDIDLMMIGWDARKGRVYAAGYDRTGKKQIPDGDYEWDRLAAIIGRRNPLWISPDRTLLPPPGEKAWKTEMMMQWNEDSLETMLRNGAENSLWAEEITANISQYETVTWDKVLPNYCRESDAEQAFSGELPPDGRIQTTE